MRFLKAPFAFVALTLMLLPASAPAMTSTLAFSGQVTVSGEPTGTGSDRGITNTGTWTASGAVTGSFAVSEQTWFGAGAVHYIGTLTGTDGSITVAVQAKFVGVSGSNAYTEGQWTITSGTGAYATLHGSGDYAGTIDESAQPKTITESLAGFGGYGS